MWLWSRLNTIGCAYEEIINMANVYVFSCSFKINHTKLSLSYIFSKRCLLFAFKKGMFVSLLT